MSTTAVSAVDAEPTEEKSDLIIIPLTSFDRCDRCQAQAYVRFVRDDQDFLFCGHHSSKFEGILINDFGFGVIQDERINLVQDRLTGSAN